MEFVLRILSSWAENFGLGINLNKTELIFFSCSHKIETFRLPILGGKALPLCAEVKYVSVIPDNKQNWIRNTEGRIKKGLNALYQCRNSMCRIWRVPPWDIHWIYYAIVKPVITYGYVVSWSILGKTF